MIVTDLRQALDYAKANHIPRVLEMRCPRCDQTIYAATDSEKHEHASWMARLKDHRSQRYVSCKRCGYGRGAGESSFIFQTHEVK